MQQKLRATRRLAEFGTLPHHHHLSRRQINNRTIEMDDDKNKSDLPELPKPRSKKLGEDENKLDKRFNASFASFLILVIV